MNERIKELAEQAGAQPVNLPQYVTLDWQKFAELIVKECSKVNDQFIGRRIGEIDLDMVYKEHFGIKE